MKKVFLSVLIFALCLVFLSCSKDNNGKEGKNKDQVTEQKQEIQKESKPLTDPGKKVKVKIENGITNMGKEYIAGKTYYDEKGKITKEVTYFMDEKQDSEISYSYDEKGLLVKKVIKGYNVVTEKNYTDVKTFKYDDKGKLISEQIKYDESGMTELTPDLYEYKYDGDKISKREEYLTYQFNEKGKKIIKNKNELISVVTYKYDSKGNLTEETPENKNESYASAIKITYEYDSNNILIKVKRNEDIFNITYEYY